MKEMLRGALLSVLFFALMIGNAPVLADDEPQDWGLGEAMNVVGQYVPVPPLQIVMPPTTPFVPEGGMGPDINIEFAQEFLNNAVKQTLRRMADQAGHTPEQVCRWYDENYRSWGMSLARIGIALGALIYMYWDLRDRQGRLSAKEIELKKQLAGVLALVAAGGAGDRIVRDACNIAGHPI